MHNSCFRLPCTGAVFISAKDAVTAADDSRRMSVTIFFVPYAFYLLKPKVITGKKIVLKSV